MERSHIDWLMAQPERVYRERDALRRSEIPPLLRRLRSTKGADLELEGAIYHALIGVDAPDAKEFYGAGRSPLTSIDMALKLVERMLPKRGYRLFKTGTAHTGMAYWFRIEGFLEKRERYPTAPLAICGALLSALVSPPSRQPEAKT